jgi:NifU-like protein involved in Fe-S cluster formation
MYNEDVRRYFADPRHAGDLQEDYELTLVADVSESDSGAHIEMSAGIRGDLISAMAYRVWGCPHLVAALTGRILLLEDALATLWAHYASTAD